MMFLYTRFLVTKIATLPKMRFHLLTAKARPLDLDILRTFTLHVCMSYSWADKCKNLSHVDTSIKIGRIIP